MCSLLHGTGYRHQIHQILMDSYIVIFYDHKYVLAATLVAILDAVLDLCVI